MSSFTGLIAGALLFFEAVVVVPPTPERQEKKIPRPAEMASSPTDPNNLFRVEKRAEGDRKKVLLEELKSLYPSSPSGI